MIDNELNNALSEYDSMTDIEKANYKKDLSGVVNATKGSIEVKEGFGITLFCLFGLGILFIVMVVIRYPKGEITGNEAIGWIIAALLSLLFALRIYTTLHIPLFTIRPEGLETSVFKTPIPWTAIENFDGSTATCKGIITVAEAFSFVLNEKYLPEQNAKSRFRSGYMKKTKTLGISCVTLRRTNCNTVLEQLELYQSAAYARQMLQAIEKHEVAYNN